LENIVYSDSRLKKRFLDILSRFVLVGLQSKLAKSANMTPKLFFFSQHFEMGVEKRRM
jgi:hypothetical protein